MILNASSSGMMTAGGQTLRCALGKGGMIAAAEKREGDGATPRGLWPLRRVLYRPDKLEAPRSRLAVAPIARNDGWCDDPDDEAYNRPVKLPYPGRCEVMWRTDGLYDVVVVLGYNDGPPKPGMGSAIFLHCAAPAFTPTEGCVAVERGALVELLALVQPGDALAVA